MKLKNPMPKFKLFRGFFSLIILLLFFAFIPLTLSGCGSGGKGNSSSGGGGGSNNSYSYTVKGTVYGGYSVLFNPVLTVSLYQIGDVNPLETTFTNLGQYSFSYTTSDSTTPLFYVVIQGVPNYQGTSNTLEAVSPFYGTTVLDVNELTTVEMDYAVNDVGGSVNTNGSLNIPSGQNDQFLSYLSPNTNNTNEIYSIANSLASCIQSKNNMAAAKACGSVISAVKNYGYVSGEGQFTIDAVKNYQSIEIPFIGASYQIENQTPWNLNETTGTALSNILPIYWSAINNSGSPMPNRLYATVTINGMPFNLLVDTGATGININLSDLENSRINITPTNFLFTTSFGSPAWVNYSGFIGLVNLTFPNGITINNFPISISTSCDAANPNDTTSCNSSNSGVNYQNNDGESISGDLGLGLSPYGGFSRNAGEETAFTPSIAAALQDSMNNGFILSLNSDANLANLGYDFVTEGEPAGNIILGLNTETDNRVLGTFYPNSSNMANNFPMIASKFGIQTADANGNAFYSMFDTGNPFIKLDNSALNDSYSSYEYYNACSEWNLIIGNILSSGLITPNFLIIYGLLSNTGNYSPLNTTTFTNPGSATIQEYICGTATIPSGEGIIAKNVFPYSTQDEGSGGQDLEQFGLPIMFNQTLFWSAPYNTQYGWGIGVTP